MGQLIQVPDLTPGARLLVAKVYGAKEQGFYYIVVIDPEKGPRFPRCRHKDEMRYEVVALSLEADSRELEFEVHDFSAEITLVFNR